MGLALVGALALGGVSLRYVAPADCPSETAFLSAVEAQLGQPLAEIDGRSLTIVAATTRTAEDWEMRVQTRTPQAQRERTLRATQCAELAELGAVVVAIAIDEASSQVTDEASSGVTDEGSSGVADEVADAPAKPIPDAPASVTQRRQALLRASAVGAFGALPGFGLGLEAGVGYLGHRVRVEAIGFFAIPRRVAASGAAGATFSMWSVGARACGVLRPGPVEVPLCGGVEAGQLRARPRGLDQARAINAPWVALTAGPAIAYAPRPRFAVLGGAVAVVPLTRPAFEVGVRGGPLRVHRPTVVGARIWGGIEVRLP